MTDILFTINIVAPVFLMVALGYIVKQIGVVNDDFVNATSKFVFNVALPALVFVKIAAIRLQDILHVDVILLSYAGVFAMFLLSWIIAYSVTKDGRDRGAIIQGGYRSNFAIVGLAILSNMYGEKAVGQASIILAFVMPLFNILAVIALTVPLNSGKALNLKKNLIEIITNPLIIAILIALPFSYYRIEINPAILKTGNYLAATALPLALVGIGATLNLRNLVTASGKAYLASSLKIVISPLLGTSAAALMGYSGETLGIIFILFGSPTAIVSFIMAHAMGSNEKLAGNIIVITTLGSIVTITIGVYILKSLQLI